MAGRRGSGGGGGSTGGGGGGTGSGSGRGEIQQQKSPAEFFADNQAIAGFDNYGKSLYTSIRELIENSLDACESIGELPSISVSIEELNEKEFNDVRGISSHRALDADLFANSSSNSKNNSKTKGRKSSTGSATAGVGKDGKTSTGTAGGSRKQEGYFIIKVKDNGCGMNHTKIPDLLGRVLSGSKYGVRQTRGKFGLGAKMALIWSKKSTGVPITITTAHRPTSKSPNPPPYVSTCVLDIDITNNCPKVLKHTKTKNTTDWVGSELELLIAGNWTTYKSRILTYLQQLAIITPYAQFELTYTQRSDNSTSNRKELNVRYDRRSEQMPPLPSEIKHHPSSVNNVIIHQLLERSRHRSIEDFLCKELSGVTPSVAKRVVDECKLNGSAASKRKKASKRRSDDDDDDEDDYSDGDSSDGDNNFKVSELLTDQQITRLVQVLRTATQFKPPDATCLSPLGEYNLNLGILKVTEPEYVATARDKPSAYEGHPFLVEAAVSLGGKDAKEGIQVTRFANRIPLLFEGGADVCTRVATNKIKWSSYKIDQKRDKIGVFVSIVSTKIPYKGTGKEYIGDDISEISTSVKRALQSCCQQLRVHLLKRNALRDQRERKNKLSKYIPDVSRSLYDLLDGMRKRRQEQSQDSNGIVSSPPKSRKRLRLDGDGKNETLPTDEIIRKLEDGDITAAIIKKRLEETVRIQNSEQEEEDLKKSRSREAIPLYLKPLFSNDKMSKHDIYHPYFVFRPMNPPIQQKKSDFTNDGTE